MKKKHIILLFSAVIALLLIVILSIIWFRGDSCDGSHLPQFNITNDVFTIYNGNLSFNNVPPMPDEGRFEFCNDHIIIVEFDKTQSLLYPDRIDSLLSRIESWREDSNATRENLIYAMQFYEFTVITDPLGAMYMKSFNGIATNDWYNYFYGSFFKSNETITSEIAWEFLQDPRNDPRNFSGRIPLEQLGDVEVYRVRVEPRIIYRNGILYPKIFVNVDFPGARGITTTGFSINTATGAVYDFMEFPFAPTFW